MKNILIVGNSYALTKRLVSYGDTVFVAPGNEEISKIAKCVDSRNSLELLSFVIENNIDFTIVISDIDDVVSVFQANEKPVFGGSFVSYAQGKKLLYRLKEPVSKFAIFDKLPLAIDYIENANYPLIIKTDKYQNCCTSFKIAKCYAEDLFSWGENKIVIEDFVFGKIYTTYAITDGYHVLPLATVQNYRFSENGDGGILTDGVGAVICPIDMEVFEHVIKKTVSGNESYVGILGVDIVRNKEGYFVLGYRNFFKNDDIQVVLNSIDENLTELFESCANGSFSDEYDEILLNDNYSVSCVVSSRQKLPQLNNLDLIDDDLVYLSDKSFVLTSCAKTLSRAKSNLEEDILLLNFKGMHYRSDIFT